MPSMLRPEYMKLVLVGGVLLVIGLFSPWYYLSEALDGGFYSLSAFGGSLVDRLDGFFRPVVGWVSFGFALVCVVFPFVCRRLRLSEGSRRKYGAVAGCLGGVCGLMSIVYFHSWFDLAYPDDSFFYSDLVVSRGLGLGYFLTWVSVGFLFLSAYVSRGLALEAEK